MWWICSLWKRKSYPESKNDNFILGYNYNYRTCDIITLSCKFVKFWSILTRKIRIVYENLMENGEITCFYFDKDMKRLFLDDGRIKKFNLSNGTFIKEFSQNNKDVVNIMLTKLNMIISISS